MLKLIGFLTVFVFVGCSKQGEQVPDDTGAIVDPAPEKTTADVVQQSPSLLVSFSSDTRLDVLDGYLVYHQDSYALKAIGQSEFAIPRVEPGNYDLIVSSLDDLGNSVGIRINGIAITAEKTAKIRDIQLKEASKVAGTVEILTDGSSTRRVSIEGTKLFVETDPSGYFSLENIPPGKHKLIASADGFHSGYIELISLASGSESQLDPIIIVSEAPSVGIRTLSIDEPTAIGLLLTAPKNTNMVRIGTDPTLDLEPWQPIKTTMWLDLESPGEKTVYAQFSSNETNISKVFSTSFTVEDPMQNSNL